MNIDITKMTSKGQVVIPQDIREEAKLKEGAKFLVYIDGERIVLQPTNRKPSTLEEFDKHFEDLWKKYPHLRKISEKDIEEEIKAVREEKRNAERNR